jgi:hypothetical protein
MKFGIGEYALNGVRILGNLILVLIATLHEVQIELHGSSWRGARLSTGTTLLLPSS